MKTIRASATKTPSGKVVAAKPGQHHKDIGVSGKRGFVTNSGSFIGRSPAAKVAKAAGQVGKLRTPGKLHSEDLLKGKK